MSPAHAGRTVLSSLRSRIFLASALVAVLSVAFAVRVVTVRAARQIENELHQDLARSARLVREQHTARVQSATLMAQLVADLPKLKAAVGTHDPPTVQPVASDYKERVRSASLSVTGPEGRVLAHLGDGGVPPLATVQAALASDEVHTFQSIPRGVLQVVSVPITVGPPPVEVLGTLSLGFALDDAAAVRFGDATESQVAFALAGSVRASTLTGGQYAALDRLLASSDEHFVAPDGHNYAVLRLPLGAGDGAPLALILRSRTERLAFLRAFRTGLAVATLVAVLLGVVLSFAVARSVTRPLSTLTAAMREMATTGDLGRSITLRGRFVDEDARLLAATFNSLIGSIARFQHEASLRQRLSALGRMSTVVAHEIRNPLMVIKASLATLRRDQAHSSDRHEAAEDVDRQVARINRIVADVLDFARELRLEQTAVDVNRLCRDAVSATLAAHPELRHHLELANGLPEVETDGERLRGVLVSLLDNAREAVLSLPTSQLSGEQAHVELRSLETADGCVAVEIADRGPGIPEEQRAHVFEPYFTTKRAGTGLGLAIAKKVMDALGGTLAAAPRPGGGTRMRLELPARPRRRTAEADQP